MSKKRYNKKQVQAYKDGMKAGAAPFEKKLNDYAGETRKVSAKADEISRNQRRQMNLTEQIAKGGQENARAIEAVSEREAVLEAQQSKLRKRSENIELSMPSISITCKSCGKPMSQHQLVCSNCGTVSNYFPFDLTDFDIKDKCLEGVSGLASTIRESDSVEQDWLYETLHDRFVKMKKIKSIAYKAMQDKGEDNAPEFRKIYNSTLKFFSDYKKIRLEIAVVGTVKAGKSSLINALIGTKLASVDATPETSILVKYRTTDAKMGNYLRISFYSERQWNILWTSAQNAEVFRAEYEQLEAEKIKYEFLGKPTKTIRCSSSEELSQKMMEWSKSDSPKHFFVKEIEVGYQSNTIPHDIYLVDTPGLSDPVRYRSDITRRYIKESDWILACIVGENLSQQPEFGFLSKVKDNKGGDVSKIFVVATKKDMLDEETESEKKKKEFLVRLGELYQNKLLAISRFSFVAAECHMLTNKVMMGEELAKAEKKKLNKALMNIDVDIEDLCDLDARNKALEYAGINDLFSRIDQIVIKNKRALMVDAILKDYNSCMRVINECSNDVIDYYEEKLGTLTSDTNSDQETIKQLKENNDKICHLRNKISVARDKLETAISVYGQED